MFTFIFRLNPPSHSCEGRNLYAEGGNCTISRRFAAAEIPTFAGRGRGVNAEISGAIPYTKIPFRRKPESLCAKTQTADSPCGE
ncbi:MAG: hypothetical protein ACR2QC_09395 [Gammaproteobacteria bacterium]